MEDRLNAIFSSFGVTEWGAVRWQDLMIRKPQLCSHDRLGFTPQAALVMAIPYRVEGEESGNLSLYAVSKDYHLYFSDLFDVLCPALSEALEPYRFVGFADHSPLDEVRAAAMACLGVIGDNGLLIHPEYGSFVFIGAILTDAPVGRPAVTPGECLHCGACRRACPSPDNCLSSFTQKKGNLPLAANEIALMRAYHTVWGCDICQSVCPMNASAAKTPIRFFWEDRMNLLTVSQVSAMDDEAFSKRAWSWRGREAILRNLNAAEDAEGGSETP